MLEFGDKLLPLKEEDKQRCILDFVWRKQGFPLAYIPGNTPNYVEG